MFAPLVSVGSQKARHTGSTPLPEATYLTRIRGGESIWSQRPRKNRAGRLPPGGNQCQASGAGLASSGHPGASAGSVLHVMPPPSTSPRWGLISSLTCQLWALTLQPWSGVCVSLGLRAANRLELHSHLPGWVAAPLRVAALSVCPFSFPPCAPLWSFSFSPSSLPLPQSFSPLSFSLCLSFLLRFLWVPYSFPPHVSHLGKQPFAP